MGTRAHKGHVPESGDEATVEAGDEKIRQLPEMAIARRKPTPVHLPGTPSGAPSDVPSDAALQNAALPDWSHVGNGKDTSFGRAKAAQILRKSCALPGAAFRTPGLRLSGSVRPMSSARPGTSKRSVASGSTVSGSVASDRFRSGRPRRGHCLCRVDARFRYLVLMKLHVMRFMI